MTLPRPLLVVFYLFALASVFFRVGSFAQQGDKFVPAGLFLRGGFATSAALSADGNTAVVGQPSDFNGSRGATWILVRSAGQWAVQGTKLFDPASFDSGEGRSVAISADGNTVIVGADEDSGLIGAARIYVRTGTTWSQQAKLVGTGVVGTWAHQGWSVAMSADGNTVAVGGYNDNSNVGAVWIFTRNGSVWTQQGTKLVGTGAIGAADQGWSVGISADGNTLAVGGQIDNSGRGAAWIWTRTAGVWTQQGSKLVGSGAVTTDVRQGISVAVSGDGNTVLVGGHSDDGGAGAVWVWGRTGSTWSQQGTKLTAAGAVGKPLFGVAVSISSDGNTAVIGGPWDDNYAGAIWIFARSGGSFTQLGSKRVGSGAAGHSVGGGYILAMQGYAVAISGDGMTVIEGTEGDSDKGAVWFFAASPDVEPGPFIKTGPASLSTGQSIGATLSWTISSAATGYDYCYDTTNDNNCLNWISAGNVLSVHADGLLPNQQYYWQVRATNGSGLPVYANGGFTNFWSLSTLPNVVQNGAFDGGVITGWQTFATPSLSYIVSNTFSWFLRFYRVPPPAGQSNQAVVFQNTGVAFANGESIEARFNLGNESSVRRRISVLLHDSDFQDLSVCTFWLAPNAPRVSYGMRSHTTKTWLNATISFYAASASSDVGSYTVDDVVMVHGGPQATDRTECVDPTKPAATGAADGGQLLINGGFDSGMTNWSTFGQFDSQMTGGVLEFRRLATDPAGVVLQQTNTAVAAGSIVTATLQLGNSSLVRKRVTVLLHDLDFSDLTACTFWLAPGQPLTQFAMRSFVTKTWANATISVYAASVGGETWTRLDNVSLRQTQGTATTGTGCFEGSTGAGG